jgi:spermidine/putrescine transport system permease protein
VVLRAARGTRPRRPQRQPQHHRLFWAALAAPGVAWLGVLFIVPFYVILTIAFGQINQVFGYPVAVWNPLRWNAANLAAAWRDIAGPAAFVLPIAVRTLLYVAAASLLSLLIAYPAAYFVARFAGRRKGLFLLMLIAPFWVSYMMRMLAWIGLLQSDGYVNKLLMTAHLISQPVNWLGGYGFTVVLGLVYGYIPYLIIVLYAGLDRIDPALIEAGRDLGLGRARTFWRVTLPLSRQPILAGLLITVLPMLGDYFTNQLLSGATGTRMLGNVIDDQLNTPGLQGEGAVFSVLLLLALVIPLVWYVVQTNRTSREVA